MSKVLVLVGPEDIRGGIYWDATGSGNPVAQGTPMALADATQVAAAVTAGLIEATAGTVYVVQPITSSLPTLPCAGIAMETVKNGSPITVAIRGIMRCWANAAIAIGTPVICVAQTTRTALQAPLLNCTDATIKVPATLPVASISYNIGLIDDAVGTVDHQAYYPVGIAKSIALAQYDAIAVELGFAQIIGTG